MQVFDDEKVRLCTLHGYKELAITKTLSTGDEELEFYYPADGPHRDALKLEYYIRTQEQEYVIKKEEPERNWVKYTACLNVEELEDYLFPYGFESKEQTITDCLEYAFDGTSWHVGECAITKKRTIDIEDCTNPWAVLQSCLSTYNVECRIDAINKVIDIYEEIGEDRGAYFAEGLNLKELTLTNDTYDFYTRIMPVGADGITIGWLYGSDYIEDYTYSKKQKTYIWVDERYSVTTSLYEDGLAKLEKLAKPYKAYTATVIDLANRSEKYKNVLDYGIGDTVTIISKATGIKEKQRIVKLVDHPQNRTKNTAELSNTTESYSQVQSTETSTAMTDAIRIANSNQKAILQDSYWTSAETQSYITASTQEILLGISETYETILDSEAKYNAAVAAGVEAAETAEAAAIEAAQAYAQAAEAGAIEATDTKLLDYSTTTEMEAAISIAVNSITLSVSETYETQLSAEAKYQAAVEAGQEAADAAEAAANEATDVKLLEYSTTTEMEAAISIAVNSITLSVSETYETQLSAEAKYQAAVEAGQEAADAAEAAANEATDIKLQSYSTKAELALKIVDGVAMLSAYADTIEFTSDTISIESTYFTLTKDGKITATSGTVGGWTITKTAMYSDYTDSDDNVYRVYIQTITGTDSWVYSIQKGTSGSDTYTAIMNILADGYIYTTNYFDSRYAKDPGFKHARNDTGYSVLFGVGSGGYNRGIYDPVYASWIIYRGQSSSVANIPSALSVSGTATISGATTLSSTLSVNGNITTSGKYTANGSSVSVFVAGLTCGGNTAYSSKALSVMGSGAVQSDFAVYGTFTNGSDSRLKTGIEAIPEEYIKLYGMLAGKVYRLIADSSHLNAGLIAQEVLAAESELGITESILVRGTGQEIDGQEDIDYYTINYQAYTVLQGAYFAAALAQLQSRIAALEAAAG